MASAECISATGIAAPPELVDSAVCFSLYKLSLQTLAIGATDIVWGFVGRHMPASAVLWQASKSVPLWLPCVLSSL